MNKCTGWDSDDDLTIYLGVMYVYTALLTMIIFFSMGIGLVRLGFSFEKA